MTSAIEVVLISGCFTLVGSLLAWFLARRTQRAQQRYDSGAAGAPTVQEIWKRQDTQERVLKAALGLLGEVAEQEHVDTSRLSKRYMKVLSDNEYLPAEWEHLVEKPK